MKNGPARFIKCTSEEWELVFLQLQKLGKYACSPVHKIHNARANRPRLTFRKLPHHTAATHPLP